MNKSSKVVLALTGLAMLCVCAAMAAPMGMGDGAGRGGMMTDGDAPAMNGDGPAMDCDRPAMDCDRPAMNEDAPAMNEERMQEMIQKLQANGVDTTTLETAIENDDREAVHTFMQENRPADAPEQNGDRPAMNEDRMHEMIQNMQANGVDTTALETAFADGDREAVHTFMQENRPADAPEQNGDRPAMNEDRMHEMIQNMQANGVDTTTLETAFADGDREAVHTFMQENRPADAGNGLHRGGPSAE